MADWATVTDVELLELSDAGMSQNKIGARFGVSQNTVWRRLMRIRGSSGKVVKKWPSGRKLAQEYAQGATFKQIAERYSMSLSTARRLIRRAEGKAW